ncbi:toxic anion resistance protein [Nosocomiicoccus ampullae]|uniref:toxic anion resistance protein n=1 Tax=Nosocomiicoccus ampullae TaxID=489910 RepID=UPI001FE9CA4B|nr:toxic anion resistance protein [Nosocomiicoccus ampullae]
MLTKNNTKDELLESPFQPVEAEIIEEPKNEYTTTFKDDEFTKEEIEQIKSIKDQIEPLNNDALIAYGANAQSQLSKFSHDMLNQVQSKEIGPVGDSLKQLMSKLKEIDPEELTKQNKNVFQRLFGKVNRSVNELLAKHKGVASQVDRISVQLESSKDLLIRDVNLLDNLYDENKAYFEALNIYIKAAELKKEELESTTLPALQEKASQSNNQMATQDVNDMVQYINRLDKRIHDLKLSRQITLQSAPQIRMIQNINQSLAEKIQSSILTSIPLWKNQMAIALTLLNQESASKAQKAVTDTTNELLTKNSEMLKQNALRTAEENERGIVDIETLKHTQDNLLETIEETLRIQTEGKEQRQQAERELVSMEEELKTRLLDIKDRYK